MHNSSLAQMQNRAVLSIWLGVASNVKITHPCMRSGCLDVPSATLICALFRWNAALMWCLCLCLLAEEGCWLEGLPPARLVGRVGCCPLCAIQGRELWHRRSAVQRCFWRHLSELQLHHPVQPKLHEPAGKHLPSAQQQCGSGCNTGSGLLPLMLRECVHLRLALRSAQCIAHGLLALPGLVQCTRGQGRS